MSIESSVSGRSSRLSRLLLRGLHFAIVDEADSVLIDEAITPLIIAGPSNVPEQESALYQWGAESAESLIENVHYTVDRRRSDAQLKDAAHDIIRSRGTTAPAGTSAARSGTNCFTCRSATWTWQPGCGPKRSSSG